MFCILILWDNKIFAVKLQINVECLPLKERLGNWIYNTVRCGDPQSSFVERLDLLEKNHSAVLDDKYTRIMEHKIVKLKIIETSRLQLDSNVIHPFVKYFSNNKEFILWTKIQVATCRKSTTKMNQWSIIRKKSLTLILSTENTNPAKIIWFCPSPQPCVISEN